jgi:predicted transcriptional regulator
MSKRTTVYISPEIHRALRIKAAATEHSMSNLIQEAIRISLAEDAIDLEAIRQRRHEPSVSFEQVLKDLHKNGKL